MFGKNETLNQKETCFVTLKTERILNVANAELIRTRYKRAQAENILQKD
jgi:hypothetical protein